ncbi:PhoX family phosphatase [Alphaproteobacteria bacterium KMM 3653]|uniref:PhoX family phosphatase n=1 Tax=Harenicola maris TaxID=2841044 RepID=A0AAP2CK28_9RHOB|nr:PhoX family phosphatase [Harenicola maris]
MSPNDMNFDDYDEKNFPRDEVTDFDRVVETALSRRGFLGGVMTFGLGSFLLGTSAMTAKAEGSKDRFGFSAIPASSEDTIHVPEGFEWETVISWGDPLWSDAPEFDEATRGTAATQARTFGDNNDGMSIFTRGGRTVFAINNEYTNTDILWGNRPEGKPANEDDIRKGMNAHGLSVFEVAQQNGKWTVVKDSDLNRRVTADTDMDLTGPAAGSDLLKTAADPTGTTSKGTWNNCGNGETPWGTYLACEENFNGYFSASDKEMEIPAEFTRYGIGVDDWGYGWAEVDERFDIAKNPNEANRAGYVVEIDPYDPTATPKKRTALGRFKHENAEVVVAANGKIVVYMGDDERGEFLYRFVSTGTYSAGGDNSALLDEGTLYAAKFNDDLSGEWLALTPEATGMTAAEIAVHTRIAASAVGATTMDRPEWVASNPAKTEVYVALTNNKNRGISGNAGGDEAPVDGPNPRENNVYGQIARWVPAEEDHTADAFTWDLFALAGNPEVGEGLNKGSENINSGNMFNSPDGLSFDDNGLLWIQTDGNYSNAEAFAGMGNNQMLAGDTTTGEIRRFLTGPNECEITGICWAPDRRTMFVGVQHPGERGNSHYPAGGTSVPRSGVVAVRRTDGAVIG